MCQIHDIGNAQESTEMTKEWIMRSMCCRNNQLNCVNLISNLLLNRTVMEQKNKKQAQRRAAAETVARKPIKHFIHDK